MFTPQGQRVTKAAPFSPRLMAKLKNTNLISTEEADLLEAKNQFKRHEVPKHVHESRPIEGFRAMSKPKKPEEIFEVT